MPLRIAAEVHEVLVAAERRSALASLAPTWTAQLVRRGIWSVDEAIQHVSQSDEPGILTVTRGALARFVSDQVLTNWTHAIMLEPADFARRHATRALIPEFGRRGMFAFALDVFADTSAHVFRNDWDGDRNAQLLFALFELRRNRPDAALDRLFRIRDPGRLASAMRVFASRLPQINLITAVDRAAAMTHGAAVTLIYLAPWLPAEHWQPALRSALAREGAWRAEDVLRHITTYDSDVQSTIVKMLHDHLRLAPGESRVIALPPPIIKNPAVELMGELDKVLEAPWSEPSDSQIRELVSRCIPSERPQFLHYLAQRMDRCDSQDPKLHLELSAASAVEDSLRFLDRAITGIETLTSNLAGSVARYPGKHQIIESLFLGLPGFQPVPLARDPLCTELRMEGLAADEGSPDVLGISHDRFPGKLGGLFFACVFDPGQRRCDTVARLISYLGPVDVLRMLEYAETLCVSPGWLATAVSGVCDSRASLIDAVAPMLTDADLHSMLRTVHRPPASRAERIAAGAIVDAVCGAGALDVGPLQCAEMHALARDSAFARAARPPRLRYESEWELRAAFLDATEDDLPAHVEELWEIARNSMNPRAFDSNRVVIFRALAKHASAAACLEFLATCWIGHHSFSVLMSQALAGVAKHMTPEDFPSALRLVDACVKANCVKSKSGPMWSALTIRKVQLDGLESARSMLHELSVPDFECVVSLMEDSLTVDDLATVVDISLSHPRGYPLGALGWFARRTAAVGYNDPKAWRAICRALQAKDRSTAFETFELCVPYVESMLPDEGGLALARECVGMLPTNHWVAVT